MANNIGAASRRMPERHSVYFQRRGRDFGKGKLLICAVRLAAFAAVLLIWELLARHYKSNLLLPSPWKVAVAFVGALHDEEVLSNLFLTLRRVITGFGMGLVIGGSLGLVMAKSKLVMQAIDPILNPLRQVPVMAWVPLSIIWFGLGEGPTLFLITLVSVFPIMLCTVSGIQGIDRDYYNAALSMGSSRVSLFYKITVPAAMPELLTGMRAGLSAGWMSVIWAEFIATSAGFGYSMVEAQTRMNTPLLIALMIMAALVGYLVDFIVCKLGSVFVRWREAA